MEQKPEEAMGEILNNDTEITVAEVHVTQRATGGYLLVNFKGEEEE